MSNHMHVVLRINKTACDTWSSLDVISRWHQLFSGNSFSHKALSSDPLTTAEQAILAIWITIWRSRLQDISWFMRCLNEPIARQANIEDQVTGRFWEGRFKSQALLDEQALAACMVYVDLNPIRAQIASTPETSDYTSVKRRILCLQTAIRGSTSPQPQELLPFAGNPRTDSPNGIPFELKDYLDLVDWSGRLVHINKRGFLAENLPPIFQRLKISTSQWQQLIKQFEHKGLCIAGLPASIKGAKNIFMLRRLKNFSAAIT